MPPEAAELEDAIARAKAEQGELREQLARQDVIIGALIAENASLKRQVEFLRQPMPAITDGFVTSANDPFANTTIHAGPTITDYSRPFSLTPPAVVQMPGQLGAPDGLPMGEPAPMSLAEENAGLRNVEQSQLQPPQ